MTARRESQIGWVALHSAILRSASLLVPPGWRETWVAEWEAELWYVRRSCGSACKELLFCLGAFRDAVSYRRNSCGAEQCAHRWLESPLYCLLLLVVVSIATTFFLFRPEGAYQEMLDGSQGQKILLGHLQLILIAVVAMPATTSLALAEHAAGWPTVTRRWLFLGTKLALVLSAVFCGTLALAPLTGLQPQVWLVMYLLALRWTVMDQGRRCPVCLRLLANASLVGRPSRTLMERRDAEYSCARGHGVLSVPEVATTYSVPRWAGLR